MTIEFSVKLWRKIGVSPIGGIVFLHVGNNGRVGFLSLPVPPDPTHRENSKGLTTSSHLSSLPFRMGGRNAEDAPMNENADLRLVVPTRSRPLIQRIPIGCVSRVRGEEKRRGKQDEPTSALHSFQPTRWPLKDNDERSEEAHCSYHRCSNEIVLSFFRYLHLVDEGQTFSVRLRAEFFFQ